MDENLPNDIPAEMIFRTEDGQTFEVTEEGSIGLLALGAVGLKAWRTVRIQAMRKRKEEGKADEELHLPLEDMPEIIDDATPTIEE